MPCLRSRRTLLAAVLALAHVALGIQRVNTLPRRSVLIAAPLVTPWAARAASAQPSDKRPLNVLITGATVGGIGFEGARKLAERGDHVYLLCRSQARADAAADAINRELGASARVPGGEAIGVECDLASLASVRACADAWRARSLPLDVLVLNAAVAPGTQETAPKRTREGFEETIGVNHLGHFLLAQLLLPELQKRGSGPQAPRLVVTASEVHNPEEPGGQVGSKATLGDLAGLRAATRGESWAMVDGGEFDPDKAYKDSKLCNMLFMLELDRRLGAARSPVCVNALSPGLITKSGLFRNQRKLFTTAFDFVATNVARFAETVEYGGGCLEFMSVSPELEGKHGLFYSDYPPGKHTLVQRVPSVEARDEAKAKQLWELSEQLVGLRRA